MTSEEVITVRSGWVMLPITFLVGLASPGMGAISVSLANQGESAAAAVTGFLSFGVGFLSFVLLLGHFTLEPNVARVLTLSGEYRGTVVEPGFHWVNPFCWKRTISLRSRNLNGDRLKVNDRRGSPIEIAAVVVWRVSDTVKALFEVDDYVAFVAIQSESAVRELASGYVYDDAAEGEFTLRGSGDEVSKALEKELQKRLRRAGVVVEEARLSHLAYAPEIAQVMLRRQQAEAIVAARAQLVQGAVSMVDTALEELSRRGVVDLRGEERARLVGNLLVVLCSESEARPVVQAGS